MFDIPITKNYGLTLLFQQFYALLLKRIINSMRNYLVLVTALLPVLFVVVSLVIEQQIPKPEDSPPLIISLERYQKTHVPYTYQSNETSLIDFIRSYESVLERSPKSPSLIDLTKDDSRICQDGHSTSIVAYLLCIGVRSLLELNDQYLIGVHAQDNYEQDVFNLTGYFNNQPYHGPPLSLNYITNGLLQQYTMDSNRSINVINHPVDK